MATRRWTFMAVLIALAMSLSQAGRCYEKDVHFNLTYVLCQMAGFTRREAQIVAIADQSMDENDTTTAFSLKFENLLKLKSPLPVNYQKHGEKWHAFYCNDSKEMPKGQIEARLKKLREKSVDTTTAAVHSQQRALQEQLNRASVQNTNPEILRVTYSVSLSKSGCKGLVQFGQFLHFYQDYFSHRKINGKELDTNGWQPYASARGHFADGHKPDRIPYRPELAKQMARECFREMELFAKDVLNRRPADVLNLQNPLPSFLGINLEDFNVSSDTVDALVDALYTAYPHGTVRHHDGDSSDGIETSYYEQAQPQIEVVRALDLALTKKLEVTVSDGKKRPMSSYIQSFPAGILEALVLGPKVFTSIQWIVFDETGEPLNLAELFFPLTEK